MFSASTRTPEGEGQNFLFSDVNAPDKVTTRTNISINWPFFHGYCGLASPPWMFKIGKHMKIAGQEFVSGVCPS